MPVLIIPTYTNKRRKLFLFPHGVTAALYSHIGYFSNIKLAILSPRGDPRNIACGHYQSIPIPENDPKKTDDPEVNRAVQMPFSFFLGAGLK